MAETQYRRLTWPRRRKAGFIAATYIRSSLWLGDDHLLVIDSNGYSETYKRFYFQDIQAIAIRLTRRRLIWNWVLGVPTAICLGGWSYDLVINRSIDLSGIVAGTVFTLLFGLPLLFNNLLGPTCACTLRTAVQTEDLPPLCRLRKTRRILDHLRPLIVQAQGQLSPEEIPARLQAWTQATAAPASGVRPSSGAATCAPSSGLGGPETSPPPDSAAPEDGRTPDGAAPVAAAADPLLASPDSPRLNGGDNTAQGNALGETPPHTTEP